MNKTARNWIVLSFALVLVVPAFTLPNAGAAAQPRGHILYVPLPPEVSRELVVSREPAALSRLDALVKAHLAREPGAQLQDRIILLTDNGGDPILPDLEAARARRGARPQAGVANELVFTFDSPTYPWSAEELAAVSTTLYDCYPVGKTVYGAPAFDITVNVRKDPTITYDGLYFISTNEMVLRSAFLQTTICHEMIHAFRDDDIIHLSTFEEGMTRTAEVEIFNRLPTYTHWDEHHSYTYDVYYEGLNRSKIGGQNGNFFLGYVSPLLRYQLAGYAWAKALLEKATFLVAFNQELYSRVLSDPTTLWTESKLKDIAALVKSTVENKPFSAWYGQQGVFTTNPEQGYILYQRINQFTVDYFYRDTNGFETMQPNATIQWAVYDHGGLLLDSGTAVTTPLGWVQLAPTLPSDYTGRIKVVVSATSPAGPVTDTAHRFIYLGNTGFDGGAEPSVFGVVQEAATGTITITPAPPASPVTVSVVNSAFNAPSLASLKGPFRAVFTNTTGRIWRKQFTKDASSYFLVMPGR